MRYTRMLQEVSTWFQAVRSRHAGEMQCGCGCVRCCHGLFDISLPEALHATLGFSALPADARSYVVEHASAIQEKIVAKAPELTAPYLLPMSDDALIDRIVSAVPSPRCPFLGPDDSCLIYEHRPLACRLEGVPMVDVQDGLFGDWCELNFTGGISEQARENLERDYYELQQIERTSTERLSKKLLGLQQEAVTVFIPSLIVEFETFWRPLLARLDPEELEFEDLPVHPRKPAPSFSI